MPDTLRLFFDECVGKPILDGLSRFVVASGETVELRHIIDYQGSGVLDKDWIPLVASEGWIVITADRGKRSKGEKLPKLCVQFEISHIMLSARIHQMKNFDKARKIIEVWPELVVAGRDKKGSGYSLRLTGDSGHAKLVKLY